MGLAQARRQYRQYLAENNGNPLLASHNPVTATDVVFLNIQGTHFRVSSTVLGLFPDSVLMAMFPTGIIPFYSVVNGKEIATTVPGVRLGAAAAAHAMVTKALESKKNGDPNSQRESRTSSSAAQGQSSKRASFGGGATLSKSSALAWQKFYNSEANGDADADAAEPEDDMESLTDSSSEEEVSVPDDEEMTDPATFSPAEHSMQMDLSGVEDHKICNISFDPKLFQFLLDYFRGVLNSNHEAMVAAEEELQMNEDRQKAEADAAKEAAAAAAGTLNKVEEETIEGENNGSASTTTKLTSGSEEVKPQITTEGAPPATRDNTDTKSPTGKRRSSNLASLNIFRRMSGFRLSIVTFFAGDSSPTKLGSQLTPSVATPEIPIPMRPIHSIIVLREELEYFPVPKWAEKVSDADKPAGMWETIKWKVRRSFSKASGRAALAGLAQGSSGSLQKFREGVELDEMRTDGNNGTSSADLVAHEVKEVKLFCGERLVKERLVAQKFAEDCIDIFERGEKERLHQSISTAEGSSKTGVNGSEEGGEQGSPLQPPQVSIEREKVACEMDEQIMKHQLIASLKIFSADFTEDETKWDYREVEKGKCRVSSVSMLKMREVADIKQAVEAGAAALEEARANSRQTPNPADLTTDSPDAATSNAPTSLVTQVSDAGVAPSVSTQHLNQHLLLKRPVRKCWWEVLTVRVDKDWIERRRSGAKSANETESEGRKSKDSGESSSIGKRLSKHRRSGDKRRKSGKAEEVIVESASGSGEIAKSAGATQESSGSPPDTRVQPETPAEVNGTGAQPNQSADASGIDNVNAGTHGEQEAGISSEPIAPIQQEHVAITIDPNEITASPASSSTDPQPQPQSSEARTSDFRVRLPPEIPLPPSPTDGTHRPSKDFGTRIHAVDVKLWVRRTWTIEFCSM